MRKQVKKIIAVVSSLTMAVAGMTVAPNTVSVKADVTWRALGNSTSKYNTVAYIDDAKYTVVTNSNAGYEGFYTNATPPWNFDMQGTDVFGFVVKDGQHPTGIIIDGTTYTDDRINFSNGNGENGDSDCFFINQDLLQVPAGQDEKIFTMEFVGLNLGEFQIKIEKLKTIGDYEWEAIDYSSLTYAANANLTANYSANALYAEYGSNPAGVEVNANNIWLLTGAEGKAIYIYINGVLEWKNETNSAMGYAVTWDKLPTSVMYNDITIVYVSATGIVQEKRVVVYNSDGSNPTESSSETDVQAPDAPVGLVVTPNKDANIITIAFAPVTGATSYNYYVDGVLGGAIANGGTIAYNSLAAGNHSIQVTAVNEGGESALSSAQNITIEGDAPSETSSEEESSGSQGGDYDGLTWTQVGTTDYYVASIHGTVKNAFPFALVEMQGDNATIHIVPGVAEGTAPIWPAFTDVTLNGVANAASVDGAGIFVPTSALNNNAYNVFEATSAVANDRFQIIIKAGNPDGPSESVVYTDDLEITGYQMNASGITVGEKTYEGGMRTLYSLPATVEGVSTEGAEFGLVYALKGKVNETDVTIANEGTYVKKSQATANGSVGNGLYAMTFATNFTTVTKAHLSREYYVRVYVIKNGVTYYGDVETFSAYSVANVVYQGSTAGSETAHNYLYDNILSVINPNYESIAYNPENIN